MKIFLLIGRTIQNFLRNAKYLCNRTLVPINPVNSLTDAYKIRYRACDAISSPCLESEPMNKRPLRVVQIQDQGPAGGGFGRIIISGKMSDVCAELDRLVAREAACI